MIKHLLRKATIASLATLSACSSTPAELAATEHSNQRMCNGIPSGLTQVTPQMMQRLQQRQFLTEPGTAKKKEQGNPPQELLVAVSHGNQSSAGYAFEFRGATLDQGVAQLNLHWRTPPPDSMQATVITSPCLVVALPPGNYQRVVAQDETGIIGAIDLEPVLKP